MFDDAIPDLVEINESYPKIPITLLTGFLGSGKTTLLNYILRENHGKRIAVIENEFGSGLGIENMIAKNGVDGGNISNFFELNNGCICCTVKDSLLITLEQLALHSQKFDYILIETTGVANPGPIITSLWTDEGDSTTRLQLDGVVTVVDCVNILSYLSSPLTCEDVKLQIAFADRILLNKIDIVDSVKLEEVERAVSAINNHAEIKRTTFSNVDVNWVLDLGSYDVSSTKGLRGLDIAFTSSPFCSPCGDNVLTNAASIPPPPTKHIASSLHTVSIVFSGRVILHKLNLLLDTLLYSFDDSSKESKHSITKSDDESRGRSSKSLDDESKEELYHKQTSHKDLDSTMDIDIGSAENLVSSERKGRRMCKIFRMKGILMIENHSKLHILQAVHDVFDIQPSQIDCADDEKMLGMNRIIVIGENINLEELESRIVNCCVD